MARPRKHGTIEQWILDGIRKHGPQSSSACAQYFVGARLSVVATRRLMEEMERRGLIVSRAEPARLRGQATVVYELARHVG